MQKTTLERSLIRPQFAPRRRVSVGTRVGTLAGLIGLLSSSAQALELNWSGVFQTEAHYVRNYSLSAGTSGLTTDATRAAAGGYYIPGGGEKSAKFQTLSLRLRPVVVVNDNVYIKSEWWVGDPIYGLFGSGAPQGSDARQIYSTQSRGAAISAQRLWAEYLSEIGTVQVGRIPLAWGLGLVWNAGDRLYDRYQSTGDAVRLVSKFGSFSFGLAAVKYSLGNSIGGNCTVNTLTGACSTTQTGGAGLSDYAFTLKYDNTDEDLEMGVQFIRRLAGALQDAGAGSLIPAQPAAGSQIAGGFGFNTWDIYFAKKAGKFTLSGEVPIVTGQIGGVNYSAFAAALESKFDASDRWELTLKAGQAPGQSGTAAGVGPDKYGFFYFNPAYRVGLIMFNYQLANFAGPTAQNNPNVGTEDLRSPYDNPITNARYLAWGTALRTGKWRFHGNWLWAQALQSAAATGNYFNTWQRRFVTNTTGQAQSKSLGWEMNYGFTYKWDDAFQFGADVGWFFPGDFYQFSNAGVFNATAPVTALVLRAGLVF